MVALRVKDFDASLTFYRDVLGVPLEVDSHNRHAEHSFHDPYFHFAIFPAAPGAESMHAHVAFGVASCREVFDRAVAAGAQPVTAPRAMPYAGGGISAVLADPDGNQVELFERA
jgi:catechol 2,3-dioxygenase-like lactoylglutathione lyase family enzyme